MIFYTALLFWAVTAVAFMLKKMSPGKIIISLLTGFSALICADLIMSLYGGNMPLNIFTLGIGTLGGIPGVILLVLLNTFFA